MVSIRIPRSTNVGLEYTNWRDRLLLQIKVFDSENSLNLEGLERLMKYLGKMKESKHGI